MRAAEHWLLYLLQRQKAPSNMRFASHCSQVIWGWVELQLNVIGSESCSLGTKAFADCSYKATESWFKCCGSRLSCLSKLCMKEGKVGLIRGWTVDLPALHTHTHHTHTLDVFFFGVLPAIPTDIMDSPDCYSNLSCLKYTTNPSSKTNSNPNWNLLPLKNKTPGKKKNLPTTTTK